MADSGWDDLFAKAGAEGLDTEQASTLSTAAKQQKRNKKKKRKRLESPGAIYQEWLEQRLSANVDDETTAANYRVGQALDPNCSSSSSSSCRGFNSNNQKDGKKKTNKNHGALVCASCGQALSLHYLHPAASQRTGFNHHYEDEEELPLALWLCTIRNLRCCAFAVATQQLDPTVLSTVIGCQQDELRRHNSGTHTLVDRLVGNHHHNVQNNKNKRIVLERCIRLVVACDQEYHDRYYRALTTKQDAADIKDLPPHPVTYFGHGFFSSMIHADDNDNDDDNNNSHALFRLHRLRFNETQRLFSSSRWNQQDSSRQEMMQALLRPPPSQQQQDNDELSFLAHHQTPAPSILSDWNDSCRDILCNLYSYATLHPSALDAIQQFLLDQQIDTLIEIGAGTGYLARLLRDGGLAKNKNKNNALNVQAYDVAPTCVSSNEYHGRVPPFFPVRQGSTAVASSRNDDKKTALLLCYPTPQTSMAHKALASYQSSLPQGQTGCFVHIGETKGLTGSSALEQLLRKEWTCTQRIPCQWWGTDASFVTTWIHNQNKPSNQTLLLPCSHCGQRESQRRCRAARPMTYCGPACFQQDQTALQQYLDQQCIPLRAAHDLDYHNPLHFSPLT